MNKAKFNNILTKSFLQKYYVRESLNTYQLAKIVKCSAHTVSDYLKKHQIKARTMEKYNNHNYIDGRCKNTYYCKEKDCNNKICSITYFKGSGRCGSCATKGSNNSMYGKTGKLAPSYIHGKAYEPYSSKFTPRLKLQIRERDNYKCQICDMTEEEHITVYGRVLEIHHIDYNKENCDKRNLITLCKPCNIRVNFNRKYWKSHLGDLLCV